MSKDQSKKPSLASLLDQEMNRQEFLKFSGATLLGLTGIGKLLSIGNSRAKGSVATGSSYGSSAYGGSKKQSIDS